MFFLRKCFLLGLPVFLIGAALVPSQHILDKKGELLRSFLSDKQTYYIPVGLDKISPYLIAAVLAAEDKRFFYHSGVDSAAVLRAAWQNAKEGEVVSGASTITQQLVRTLHPRPKTLWGKVKESFSAVATEQQFSKEEILEQYFNNVAFGNLTQGVESASLFYFNLPSSEISLAQAAFLVGLIKSPTYYNPLTHFERAKKRQEYVLKRMYEEKLVNEEIYQLALSETITLARNAAPFQAPHFVQFLKPFLPAGEDFIYSTLDSEIQTFVAQTLKTQIAHLTEHNVTNGAVVVLENETGAVLAYVGSADFYDSLHSGQVDGVRALRQAGSTLKPFVYALAFEEKKLTPATLLADTDTFFEGGFRPHNYDEKEHGLVSVRTALASSYNIPAVKAAELMGAFNVLVFLQKNGFLTLVKPADFYGLGLSLGNGEVRLLDLTNAYATLARGGIFKPLKLASKPTILTEGKSRRVMRETTAFLITDILKDNQARMPAFGLNSPLYEPFEFAAKTGTSKDYKDNFAIGYTPRWTVGVWVGNFDASPMQKVSGVTGAGPVLHDVALFMQRKYPSENFKMVSGVVRKNVCAESGLLAGKNCTHTHEEVFDEQNIPAVCSGVHNPKEEKLVITSPTQGDIYKIDPSVPRVSQQIKWEASCAENNCVWQLNGQLLKDTSCKTWWPLSVGKHTLQVTCGKETAHTYFEVLE